MFRGIDEARETYEHLVDTFPTSGRFWKTYIEQEVSCLLFLVIYLFIFCR